MKRRRHTPEQIIRNISTGKLRNTLNGPPFSGALGNEGAPGNTER